MHLRPAAELQEQALGVLRAERARLLPAVPGGALVLTGASSLPDALTKGDVDLHLRVPARDFARAVVELTRRYRIVHPDIWTDEFATFAIDDQPLPAGIAVTAIDGEHDRLFVATWQRLARDPAALAAYNDVKRAAADGSDDAYGRAKSAFFAELMRHS